MIGPILHELHVTWNAMGAPNNLGSYNSISKLGDEQIAKSQ